jgi:hypothetical protein
MSANTVSGFTLKTVVAVFAEADNTQHFTQHIPESCEIIYKTPAMKANGQGHYRLSVGYFNKADSFAVGAETSLPSSSTTTTIRPILRTTWELGM